MQAHPYQTQKAYHIRRMGELQRLRTPYESHWGEIAEFIDPSCFRRELDQGLGNKKRGKIIDSTGTTAFRTLASGFHSGASSPARPWYRLSTFDTDQKEQAAVKAHIHERQARQMEVLAGSNFYRVMHSAYGTLGKLGQFCCLLLEDEIDVVRLLQLQHGAFWIARDHRGICDTVYRRFSWTVERVVERFGYANCSYSTQTAYDTRNYDQKVTVCHAVEPRTRRNAGKIDKKNKPFLSNYWEDGTGSSDTKMLEESGFDENPIICPAWELEADDTYASTWPGEVALADVKMLQAEQRTKLKAIDEMADPALQGPTALKNNHRSFLPGSITYVDDPTGKGLRPVKEVDLNISYLRDDIEEVRKRIERATFADLFLMLENLEGIQPRNDFEIGERKEEKLLALGPVLENLYSALAQVISRTDAIMGRRGLLPESPPELQGQALKIEYISVLAQAQRAVGTGAIERFAGFIGNHAAIKPDLMDKYDADEAADQYAEMLGVPPAIVLSDDKVKEIREARAKEQQRAAQIEQAAAMAPAVKQGADAARLLSEIDTNGPFSTMVNGGV